MKSVLTETRPLAHVPRTVIILLGTALLLQCLWHASWFNLEKRKTELQSSPDSHIVRLLGLSDDLPVAKFIMLWLQAFDNQPGISLSLSELNYAHVTEWLDLIMELDAVTQYPLLAAARFYAEVPDPGRQRQMIAFITEKFLEAPNRRWPAMAHTVYVAKHRMKDLPLAQECARLLRVHTRAELVPHWARQMEFFVLEDMGELEAAKILIGGLLESGELKDKHQQRFLSQRLQELEQRIDEGNQ